MPIYNESHFALRSGTTIEQPSNHAIIQFESIRMDKAEQLMAYYGIMVKGFTIILWHG